GRHRHDTLAPAAGPPARGVPPTTRPSQRGAARTGTESVMGLLEDALRETLAAKVASPPTVDSPADRAIRAAVLVQRRRAVGFSPTAVVGALALTLSIGLVAGTRIGTGIGLAGPKPDRVLSVPFATAVDAPAYVLSGGEIVGPTGSQVSVRGQMATRAWRLPGAYLVESRTPVSSGVILWHVPVNGAPR